LFNWVSSTVVTIERDVLSNKGLETDENSSLIESDAEPPHHHYTESEAIVLEIDEVDHKEKYLRFIKDGSAYILLFAMLLSLGPSEMYITNMGSLLRAVSPASEVSNQVSLHAVFSTLSRLSLGALSDFLLHRYQVSRIVLLLSILLLSALTQLLIANSVFLEHQYYIISALSGFSYGGLFTLFPTVVLSIWGSDIFGSTWGSFMIAPAIGSSQFGMIYAVIFDSKCSVDSQSIFASNCISAMFWITTASFIMGLLLVLIAWRLIWHGRKSVDL
jgi:MFS family permease